jgi:hypothetical protein
MNDRDKPRSGGKHIYEGVFDYTLPRPPALGEERAYSASERGPPPHQMDRTRHHHQKSSSPVPSSFLAVFYFFKRIIERTILQKSHTKSTMVALIGLVRGPLRVTTNPRCRPRPVSRGRSRCTTSCRIRTGSSCSCATSNSKGPNTRTL